MSGLPAILRPEAAATEQLRLSSSGEAVDELSPYDRATVSLWRCSHTELTDEAAHRQLAEAGMHAVLAGLRHWSEPQALLAAYEANTAADFALVRSLLPSDIPEEMIWRVREAAFYLRWLELKGSAG